MAESKTQAGNFFEDFRLGDRLVHATPRTATAGDVALYQGLTGGRFAVQSSAEFARSLGLPGAPLDDLLTFHLVFGKSVPDVSLNAVANLGYAEGRFHRSVFPGDTLTALSTVIGLKENSNGQTGTVYVRTEGRSQGGDLVLDFVRWVMVRKRDPATPPPPPVVPALAAAVGADQLIVPAGVDAGGFDAALAGSPFLWDDYAVGERIDHVDGMTIEEAEHMIATRLYQNTARVHFNQWTEKDGRFGRRLIYGGHIISLARALSFNGLGNGVFVAAINGGRHAAPTFAGDTIFAWSAILAKEALPGRRDLGALRVRMIATKNRPATDFPADGEAVVLDFDYWLLMPRRR